ncbi:MAG: TolC family protein [Balneolaceae bacterium]|nr:TolC family protein [Balneolaceae bacterium]
MFNTMIIRFAVFSTLLGFICSGPLLAQDTLTVEEALSIGLENNYSIRIAGNDSEIAANNYTLGNAGFLPTLTATGSRSYSIQDSKQEFAQGGIPNNTTENAKSNSTNANASLNWTIFDGLRMFTTYDRLNELKALGDEQFRLTLENTIASIISAYYNIIRQQKIYDVLESTVEVSEQRISIAETRKDLGSGSEYDLLQARADLNADKAAVIRQEVQLNSAKILLNELLSREINTEFSVMESIPLDEDLEYNELLQKAMQNNKQLTVARINQKVAGLEIRELQGERYPEVNLNAGYNYSRNESGAGFIELNQSDGFNYGVTARLNIFDGFNTGRQIENAKIRQKNFEMAVEDQKLQLEAGMSAEFRNYLNSLELVKLESENLIFAEQSLEIALERFKLGTINSIELREVQRTLISAESRLIQAQFEAKLAETELQRISGSLTQEEI